MIFFTFFYLRWMFQLITFLNIGFHGKIKIIQPTKIAVEPVKIAVKAVRLTKFLKNLSGSNFAAIKTMFSFLKFQLTAFTGTLLQVVANYCCNASATWPFKWKILFMRVVQLIINFYGPQTLKKLYKKIQSSIISI